MLMMNSVKNTKFIKMRFRYIGELLLLDIIKSHAQWASVL